MVQSHYKRIKQILLSVLFVLGLLLGVGFGQVTSLAHRSHAMAQAVNAEQLTQRGVEHYQTRDFTTAIQDWETALSLYQNDGNLRQVALVLENLARAHQALRQTDEELQRWQQAESVYRQVSNFRQAGRMLTEQAQLYSRLGQYDKAINLLCAAPGQPCRDDSALGTLRALPTQDLAGEVAALGSLGDAYRLQGKAEQAINYLEQSLAMAETLQEPIYLISAHHSLGNAYLSLAQLNYRRAESAEQIKEMQEAEEFNQSAKTDDEKALKHLEASAALAQTHQDRVGELRASVSALPIHYRLSQAAGETRLQQVIALMENLPNTQESVYAAIDLSRLVQSPSGAVAVSRDCISQTIAPQAEALLRQAIVTAQQISDQRAESFALGELGHLYECQLDYEQALSLTQQAQWAADQQLQARDSLYLWQWQTGRILKALNQPTEAIQAYEASLATLEALRQDILTSSRDVQFDFRESVEPIYRELVELRLQQSQPSVLMPISIAASSRSEPAKDNVSRALDTLDNLKLAELQNYFGNDCVLTALNTENRATITTSQTAIFSTALLGDRVAVIMNFSSQLIGEAPQFFQQFEWIKDDPGNEVDQTTVIETVNAYREGLERIRDAVPGAPLGGYDPQLATQLYDWLIRPFGPLLQQHQIKTLVFVQDGIFRSAPMTALYDGSKFLVQNYAVAMTPSLGLTDLAAAERQQLRALAVGLTQPTTVNDIPFATLNYVEAELDAIQALLPRSLELKDESFTLTQFEQALTANTYPIIHIATHGKFSAEAENAFLVTGDNLTQTEPKLTLTVLDDLIRQKSSRTPVELLVLSACQTATGDDRAALGLAGIAAQAGAKRVLASLWSINDQATTRLIEQFYQGLLNQNLTQAQALQTAQQALINSGERAAHPGYWSAFVLIGNWL